MWLVVLTLPKTFSELPPYAKGALSIESQCKHYWKLFKTSNGYNAHMFALLISKLQEKLPCILPKIAHLPCKNPMGSRVFLGDSQTEGTIDQRRTCQIRLSLGRSAPHSADFWSSKQVCKQSGSEVQKSALRRVDRPEDKRNCRVCLDQVYLLVFLSDYLNLYSLR